MSQGQAPKFKVGDSVVLVKDLVGWPDRQPFVVAIINDFGHSFGALYMPKRGIGAYEAELELESVVNSPLYKALS